MRLHEEHQEWGFRVSQLEQPELTLSMSTHLHYLPMPCQMYVDAQTLYSLIPSRRLVHVLVVRIHLLHVPTMLQVIFSIAPQRKGKV